MERGIAAAVMIITRLVRIRVAAFDDQSANANTNADAENTSTAVAEPDLRQTVIMPMLTTMPNTTPNLRLGQN